MANNAAPRFILLPYEEMKGDLEAYYGLRSGQRSHYVRRENFRPDVLSFVQPKQLVDTETHPGFVPVKMGEDGRRVMSRSVEKMLGGIDYRYMHEAVEHMGQVKPHLYRTLKALTNRMPGVTNQMIAERLGYEDPGTISDHINAITETVYDYLAWVADRWPTGSGA